MQLIYGFEMQELKIAHDPQILHVDVSLPVYHI